MNSLSFVTGIMNDNGNRHLRFGSEQEMQCEDTTIDDSSIQPTIYSSNSDWNNQQSSNYSSPASYSKSHSKGSKKVKSEEGDEDIDIDSFVQQDVQRIPVKTLRKVIPKLRIAVYCAEMLSSGKRKLKHLWDERPADWPTTVPFKDPNNACKDVKKPGKDELGPMFNFLKTKYLQNHHSNTHQQTATSYPSETDYSFSHQVMTESSNDKDAFYTSVSSNPILPQIHYDQPANDTNGFVVSPKSEPTAYVDISELMKQDRGHPLPISSQLVMSPATAVSAASKLQPVTELYNRLLKKSNDVQLLSTAECRSRVASVLTSVQQEVITKLHNQITLSSDTRVSLMFLDAGHQMEALLDVMIVLGQVDVQLLQNGCHEIIKKFNTPEEVTVALLNQVVPQQPKIDPMPFSQSNSYRTEYGNDMLDDDSGKMVDEMWNLLGLDGIKGKMDGTSVPQDDLTRPVQLFKPRLGAEGVQPNSDMGIQPRPLVPSPPSDDWKSTYGIQGMHVVEKDSSLSKLSQQQQFQRILQSLQSGSQKSTDSPDIISTENPFVTKETAYLTELSEENMEYMLNDISDILSETQSEMMHGIETGTGYGDQHSQLVPTNATSVIPAMVEGLTCADSESEDSNISFPPTALSRQGRGSMTVGEVGGDGGGGGRGGGGGGGGGTPSYVSTRPFESVYSPWSLDNHY